MLRAHIFLLFNICFLQSQIIVHVEKALLIEIITYNIDNLRAVIFYRWSVRSLTTEIGLMKKKLLHKNIFLFINFILRPTLCKYFFLSAGQPIKGYCFQ